MIKMSVYKSISYVTAWSNEVGSGIELVKTFFSSWCLYTCRLKGKLMRARMTNVSIHFILKQLPYFGMYA
jgi:hypothetical protein